MGRPARGSYAWLVAPYGRYNIHNALRRLPQRKMFEEHDFLSLDSLFFGGVVCQK